MRNDHQIPAAGRRRGHQPRTILNTDLPEKIRAAIDSGDGGDFSGFHYEAIIRCLKSKSYTYKEEMPFRPDTDCMGSRWLHPDGDLIAEVAMCTALGSFTDIQFKKPAGIIRGKSDGMS